MITQGIRREIKRLEELIMKLPTETERHWARNQLTVLTLRLEQRELDAIEQEALKRFEFHLEMALRLVMLKNIKRFATTHI